MSAEIPEVAGRIWNPMQHKTKLCPAYNLFTPRIQAGESIRTGLWSKLSIPNYATLNQKD
jgi:hypothetical protein